MCHKVRNAIRNRRGFTFLAVMFLALLIGTGSSVAAKRWKTVVQRDKESELLFRGQAIQRAIGRYYHGQAGAAQYPRSLDDLLQDPRSAGTVRYLRKLYVDPMTGEDWVLIRDGKERIKGVRSESEKAPLKVANFPDALKTFEGKKSYAAWLFEYKPQPVPTPNPTPTKSLPVTISPGSDEEDDAE